MRNEKKLISAVERMHYECASLCHTRASNYNQILDPIWCLEQNQISFKSNERMGGIQFLGNSSQPCQFGISKRALHMENMEATTDYLKTCSNKHARLQ